MTDTNVMTPYAAHKLVNAALQEAGLEKVIPPQMMYNYTTGRLQKGKKPFIAYDPKKGVDPTDLKRWIASYVENQKAKATVPSE